MSMQKIRSAALEYLKNITIIKEHSKMSKLKYEKLEMQKYLYSNKINKTEGQQLFKFRTRMALFGNNFRNGLDNIECPLCRKPNSIDSETHSLVCETIKNKMPEVVLENIDINNLYSKNVSKMKETINIFMNILKIRKELLPNKKI